MWHWDRPRDVTLDCYSNAKIRYYRLGRTNRLEACHQRLLLKTCCSLGVAVGCILRVRSMKLSILEVLIGFGPKGELCI